MHPPKHNKTSSASHSKPGTVLAWCCHLANLMLKKGKGSGFI